MSTAAAPSTTESSPAPILEARAVAKTYHLKVGRFKREDVPVLHGVDLGVEPGQWVAILGASGSGKSTLLHLLAGLDRPDSKTEGGVFFESQAVTRFGSRSLDRYRARSVGLVFQFYHLLPELSVVENVLLGAMVRRGRFAYRRAQPEARARATELLESFGLAHRLRHRPSQLSGGERQRVAIARALINDPKVLLADEPTGNLDHDTGQAIIDALAAERERTGRTLVMVTHDPQLASRADRVVHLAEGRIVETSRTEADPS